MALRFVAGGNFSGRTDFLLALAERSEGAYLHPDLELNFSGLAETVAGERFLHEAGSSDCQAQALRTLSGGERATLVLDCALAREPMALAVDCALEQLDSVRRSDALARISAFAESRDVWLSDNRIEAGDSYLIMEPPAADADGMAPPVEFNCALYAAADALCPGSGAPVISASGLQFSYPNGTSVFDETSFTLPPGTVHLLKAPNGAGKSTLARLLVGVLRPSRGRIEANGTWLDSSNKPFFYAFQNARDQIFGRSVLGYLREAARLGHRRRCCWHEEWGRADEAAAAFGLVSFADAEVWDLPPVALKRLGLAAAFTSGAPWLFLDEPALGLDSEGRVALGHLLVRAAECGRGIIVVSHGDEFDCLPNVELLSISGRALHTGGAQ